MPTIKILGTAGYHPSETRETLCHFIPEYGFVLDMGTGAYRLRGRIKTAHLDIFLSHLHLDHAIGTTFLIDILWGTGIKDVTIFGLKEHLDYLQEKLFGSYLFPIEFGKDPLHYHLSPITPGTIITRRGVKISTQKLVHPGDSVGYRFEFPDGEILAYVTDTTQSEDYLGLIKNADTLIHECNFPDSWREHAVKTGHSWASDVTRLAKKAGVRKLVLTHFNPLDTSEDPTHQTEAEETFPGTIIAKDFMEISL